METTDPVPVLLQKPVLGMIVGMTKVFFYKTEAKRKQLIKLSHLRNIV